MNKKRGFTLIELLVVVLIIGILAAVALPQYTVAVEKSRAMTLISLISAIGRAEEVYYLANGAYTRDLFALDIEPPSGSTASETVLTLPNGQHLSLSSGSSGYLAGGTHYVQIDLFLENTSINERPGLFCYAGAEDPVGQRICKSLGRATGRTSHCSWVQGSKENCLQYEIK